MLNRSYQRGGRTAPLRGFHRRTSKARRLERAGQLRLGLRGHLSLATPAPSVAIAEPETIEQAVDYLFPIRPMTEDELAAEFNRLFPPP